MVCFKWVRTTTRCRGVGVLMMFHLFVVGGVVVLAVDVVGWQIFVEPYLEATKYAIRSHILLKQSGKLKVTI